MIIRKPYAFLIKNFKKIHIIMLLLSLFVAYKIFDINSFVLDFMRLGTYDLYQDPITNHISFLLQLSVILLFIGSAAILFLLRYKEKPWKIYLVPIIEYLSLFFVLGMIKGFFNNYTYDVETTDLRLARDLLMIFAIAQVPAIGIYIMRIFGLDKKRFNFNMDKEFLELSEKDREEVEINLDIDKNSFVRFYKKAIRNIKYFYIEHKKVCIILLILAIMLGGYQIYNNRFVVNKTYKEGDFYSANGYTMNVKTAYYTDKDYAGKKISKKSDFVIVDLVVKNNSEPRTIKLENFHIQNGNKDFTYTNNTYEKEFQDLGKTYKTVKTLKRDEEAEFIIIFKVDRKLNIKKFVLCYQEESGYLRKIKINTQDLSKIAPAKTLYLGDELNVDIKSNPDTVSINYIEISNKAEYMIRNCTSDECLSEKVTTRANGEYKILRMEFGSEIYDANQMIKFLNRYGKITYKDEDGEDQELEIENVIKRKYYGKVLFIKLPNKIKNDTKLNINLKIRNKEYNYGLN